MKRMKLAALALSLVGVLAANALAAGTDTTDVDVTATVSDVCIATTTVDITINAIDPTTATGPISSIDKGTPGKISVKCTAGTTVTFSAPATADLIGEVNGGTLTINTIAPTVTATNNQPGVDGKEYDVNASIDYGVYSIATADTYKGSFTVTVNP